jgi:RNA polymerase sigma-70 factor (ECF subfamily)
VEARPARLAGAIRSTVGQSRKCPISCSKLEMAGGGSETESQDHTSGRVPLPEPRQPGDAQRPEVPAAQARSPFAPAAGSQGRARADLAASPAEGGPSDADLLRMHIDGDSDAFGTLFKRHKDRLWAVAIRTLGDPEDAADALQDAMVSAFRRASSFRGDSAVTTWLHRIVVNACLDRMRRRAARPTASGPAEDALDAMASGRPLSNPSGATDTAMDVMAALRQLVPDQQAALVLVDMLGYSVSDAAQVLGVSEGTVKSRAARGRARLVPRLAHLRPGLAPSHDNRNLPASQRVQPAQEGGDDNR